jgi:hypothetical protein
VATVKRRRRGQRALKLTDAEELELICGPGGESAFSSESARREGWALHAEWLIEACNRSTRPWAYWQYDIQLQPSGNDMDALKRLGLLTPQEMRLLAAWAAGKKNEVSE